MNNFVFPYLGSGLASWQQRQLPVMSTCMPSTTSSLKPSMNLLQIFSRVIGLILTLIVSLTECMDCSKLLFTSATWHFLALDWVFCVELLAT